MKTTSSASATCALAAETLAQLGAPFGECCLGAKPGGGNSIGCTEDATDWPTLMRAAAEAGVKWAIVECEERRNTYQDVEDAMQFLKNLKI